MSKTWKLCPFGEQAETLRKERGMPKTELCRRLSITPTYYNLIIHGERSVEPQRQRILDALLDFRPKDGSYAT